MLYFAYINFELVRLDSYRFEDYLSIVSYKLLTLRQVS
jgi:hypothetical protein